MKQTLSFISEDNYALHREYLETLKLKYSVFSKSYPKIPCGTLSQLKRAAIGRDEREEGLLLLGEIVAHEKYFASFCERTKPNSKIRQEHGSEASFVYDIFTLTNKSRSDWMLICITKSTPRIVFTDFPYKVLLKEDVRLAVDLCEHAYFNDYKFRREEYIKRALASLDLSKLG